MSELAYANTGVLMSGGMSTSLWPPGRPIPKALMPFWWGEEDFPEEAGGTLVGHLAALEFANSGIEETIVLTTEDALQQIEKFFTEELTEGEVAMAALLGKHDAVAAELDRVRKGYNRMHFQFVKQPGKSVEQDTDQPNEPYGTAWAVECVRQVLHTTLQESRS